MVKLRLPSFGWVVRWLWPFQLEKPVFRWQSVHVRWTARQLRQKKTDVNSLLQSMWSPNVCKSEPLFCVRKRNQTSFSQSKAVVVPNTRACLPLTTHRLTFLVQLSKTSPLRQPLSAQLLRNPNITPFHCVLNICMQMSFDKCDTGIRHHHSKRINGKWECLHRINI